MEHNKIRTESHATETFLWGQNNLNVKIFNNINVCLKLWTRQGFHPATKSQTMSHKQQTIIWKECTQTRFSTAECHWQNKHTYERREVETWKRRHASLKFCMELERKHWDRKCVENDKVMDDFKKTTTHIHTMYAGAQPHAHTDAQTHTRVYSLSVHCSALT